MTGSKLLFVDETYKIRGAVFAVGSELGGGFLEAVYQECLAIEFQEQGIPFKASAPLKLAYKGRQLKQTYVADFLCFERIIVELKAVRELAPEHRAQLMNYLKASGLRVGLLVNFGPSDKAQIERIVV